MRRPIWRREGVLSVRKDEQKEEEDEEGGEAD